MLAGVAAAWVVNPVDVRAHAVIGDRLFPATLAIDDPGIADEVSLPTFTRSVGADGTVEHDFAFEFNKTITPNIVVFIGDTYSRFSNGQQGFQNLQVGTKVAIYGNVEHEVLVAAGAVATVGGTGASAFANRYSTIGPQIYVGKGFGDLPRSLDALRPVAITGQFGFAIPTQSNTLSTVFDANGTPSANVAQNPTILNWGFSLQYSLIYLNEHISPIAGPEFLQHLVPTVEVALQSPIANTPVGARTTLGTVQPGVFYERETYQIGIEALLPINGASGKHPGVVAQAHFFFEDIFPKTLGRPLFGGDEGGEDHHHHDDHDHLHNGGHGEN